ncbi:hypothetical protein CYG48_03060 [Neorhizobium sp. SOG26]|uniref:type II toxin-antitoxin system RelE/ParE family toxin n=1 Tax=Neorhizobium sp. SOG26 TaxID=2060726 RepID=UPI000E592645|nr:type II toxin-antitoxin system RelE/ParE family toxin [Neorhizobium sp. SOG26]AXV14770.1 hypothetical protein CYG48_03060 [Neorhizobium sp. SOG26]
MKKVRVSTMAADYIRSERGYLTKFSIAAARELSRKLRNAQMLLRRHPEAGKVKPGSGGVRVLIVPPYVIEYEVHPDEIMILVIRHGRQEERHEEDEDWFED